MSHEAFLIARLTGFGGGLEPWQRPVSFLSLTNWWKALECTMYDEKQRETKKTFSLLPDSHEHMIIESTMAESLCDNTETPAS